MATMEMRRTTLQRKDRDELTQIATALGKKPASRARKAEIIDLILDLASESSAETESTETEPTETESTETESTETESTDTEPAETENSEAPEAASVDTDKPATDKKPTTNERSNRSTPRGEGPRAGDSGPPAQSSSEGSNRNAGSASETGDAGEDEAGNRRRRRRGRDRDRDRTDDLNDNDSTPVSGLLDLRDEGYGFLRVNGLVPTKDDAYVPVKMIRQYGLRRGDLVSGTSRPANRNEKNPALVTLDEVNGAAPESATTRREFYSLKATHPNVPITLRTDGDRTGAVIDAIAPIGRGQRGLLLTSPASGGSSLLIALAQAIEKNDPDAQLVVLMIDERPEEVTDMIDAVESAEVVSSTIDQPPEEHTLVAELTVERAKRMVEDGHDVVIIADGLTRLARAYNASGPSTGRTIAGGIDVGAFHPTKRFFGAARNIADGGSLTILATAMVDTGSAIDDAIVREVEGDANMVLRVDRYLADRGLFPAVDVYSSATRNDEGLIDPDRSDSILALRSALNDIKADDDRMLNGLRQVLDKLS